MAGYIKTYKTYVFKDKDPVIDELRTIVQDHNVAYAQISEGSGVSVTCLHNWFHGATRRPQSASVEAVGRFFGLKREWKRFNADSPYHRLKDAGKVRAIRHTKRKK